MNPAGYFESQRVLSFLIENQERFSMPRAHAFTNMTDRNNSNSNAIPPSNSKVAAPPKSFNKAKKEQRPNLQQQQRSSAIYSLAAGSYSESGIESILDDADLEIPPPIVTLRRNKTVPSRRDKYGSHEPQQIVHVNRTSSQGNSRRGYLRTTPIGLPTQESI